MIILFTRLAAFTFVLGGALAHADVLVEPFGGYHLGQARQSGLPNQDYKMTNYGARVGYRGVGLMAGVEYMTGEGTEDDTKAKLKPTNMGVFVGYTSPVMLRIYGVYSFDAKLDRTVKTVTDSYSEGSAVKVGVGITSLSLIALNVEYMTSTYGKINNAPVDHKYITGSYGLSLSFPLTF